LSDDVKKAQQREIVHYLLRNSRKYRRKIGFGKQKSILFRKLIGFDAADAWISRSWVFEPFKTPTGRLTGTNAKLLVDEQALYKAVLYFYLLFHTNLVKDVVGIVMEYSPVMPTEHQSATMDFRERHAHTVNRKLWRD
jgi:hypothetical protein